MNSSGRACLVVLVIVGWCGCGPRRPELAHVEGTVQLDGKPLPQGTVMFEAPGRRPATARIDNGRIVEPTTYLPGDGVPPGAHRVAVVAREPAAVVAPGNPGQAAALPAQAMAGRLLVPRRYTQPGTSGLAVTITAGRNTINLELSSTPP